MRTLTLYRPPLPVFYFQAHTPTSTARYKYHTKQEYLIPGNPDTFTDRTTRGIAAESKGKRHILAWMSSLVMSLIVGTNFLKGPNYVSIYYEHVHVETDISFHTTTYMGTS